MKGQTTTGYVYVLYDIGSGLTKVGCTNNLDRRMKEIQTNNPLACEVFVFEVDGVKRGRASYYNVEQQIHKMLDDKRTSWPGEWFVLEKSDIEKLLRFSIGEDWEESKTRIDVLYGKDEIWDAMQKQATVPYTIYPIREPA